MINNVFFKQKSVSTYMLLEVMIYSLSGFTTYCNTLGTYSVNSWIIYVCLNSYKYIKGINDDHISNHIQISVILWIFWIGSCYCFTDAVHSGSTEFRIFSSNRSSRSQWNLHSTYLQSLKSHAKYHCSKKSRLDFQVLYSEDSEGLLIKKVDAVLLRL